MPLPDLIEIVPLDKPVRAEITVPGSKSITNRALILAALADGEVTLEGALWSEDTQVMTEALLKLGFEINVEPDPEEFCNRRITVKGQGGRIPNAGTVEKPLELFVGNAGTAARFLAAMVCMGEGVYRLSGVPRMHERPQAALFQALRELGYRVDSPNDKLPTVIRGDGMERGSMSRSSSEMQSAAGHRPALRHRACTVSIEESSQFASALLLCAKRGGWDVKIVGENAEESPYVAMTSKLVEAFPQSGGKFRIEPDASSGSYFWAAAVLNPHAFSERDAEVAELVRQSYAPSELAGHLSQCHVPRDIFEATLEIVRSKNPDLAREYDDLISRRSWIFVLKWPSTTYPPSDSQIDSAFPLHLNWRKTRELSRRTDLGDSIMTLVAIAPTGPSPIKFTDLGRLRLQECERVVALRTELTKCGAKVIEEGDTLMVYPSKLRGAEIETYNDHRMAMCFAILGLKVPGIRIKNPACVKKTFPNFFQKLATPPPKGLGATILDAKSGRKLEVDELFAE